MYTTKQKFWYNLCGGEAYHSKNFIIILWEIVSLIRINIWADHYNKKKYSKIWQIKKSDYNEYVDKKVNI